jgi:hypothetical protein
MIGIITGDIVNSRKLSSEIWMNGFKQLLNTFGKNPIEWEIYRGDEFQLEVKNSEEALIIALQIKSYFKSLKLDVRMSIGFGDLTYKADKISESNGTAFSRSGEVFETLKKQKINLAVNSGNEAFDTEINLMLRLSLVFMDSWLAQSAEFVLTTIENPSLSQEEIGVKLGINQAAVSRRRKRAQFDLVMEMEQYFRTKIKTLSV